MHVILRACALLGIACICMMHDACVATPLAFFPSCYNCVYEYSYRMLLAKRETKKQGGADGKEGLHTAKALTSSAAPMLSLPRLSTFHFHPLLAWMPSVCRMQMNQWIL